MRFLFLILAVFAVAARAEPGVAELEQQLFAGERLLEKKDLPRRLLLAGFAEDKEDFAYDALARWVKKTATERLARQGREEHLAVAATAAAAMNFLQLRHRGGGTTPEHVDWLLATDDRLDIVVGLLTPFDNWPQFGRIVDLLYTHDERGRDKYFNLILALAVVWDQPRLPLHGQTGDRVPPPDDDLAAYYDYFKDLYDSRDARVRYDDLSARALVFVVDTPAALAELQWARAEIRGTHRNWGSRYDDVDYRTDRVDRGQYVWTEGPYALAAIKQKGGICVDQAYFATLTARANGIPAMIFGGQGRRGPHAWFGFRKAEGDWEMDVGRYRFDKYQTGHAVDPQTNRPMTDHDVAFSCDRAFGRHGFQVAQDCGLLAVQLAGLEEPKASWAFAERAIQLVDVYDLAWRVQQHLLEQHGKQEEAVALLDRKARVFRDYPDYVLGVRREQARLLADLGRPDEAADVLAGTEREVDDRDDLLGMVVIQQVRQLEAAGKAEEACDKLEDLIQDQRREGDKVFPLLVEYLRLTKATERTGDAIRFLKRRARRAPGEYEEAYLKLLYQAYLNDGDDRNAQRTAEKLDRVRGRF